MRKAIIAVLLATAAVGAHAETCDQLSQSVYNIATYRDQHHSMWDALDAVDSKKYPQPFKNQAYRLVHFVYNTSYGTMSATELRDRAKFDCENNE